MATNSSLMQEIDDRNRIIFSLPLEILYRVVNNLALTDLIAFKFTCKYLLRLCQSPLAYEHLVVDVRIKVKKVLRKSDLHYFVGTKSITCLDCAPLSVENFINAKFQNFPKLQSINFIHTPIQLKFIMEMPAEVVNNLRSVKLCITVPYIFPGSGFWSCEERKLLKMLLIGFLSDLLQAGSIDDLCLMFILEDRICNIHSERSTSDDLQLDLLKLPRRVRIENLSQFSFEINNPLLLFSKFYSVQEFHLKQQTSNYSDFTIPILFSLPITSDHPTAITRRSLYLSPNLLPAHETDPTLVADSLHTAYHSINWIPEVLINSIDSNVLSFLDLSGSASKLAVSFELKLLHNLQSLNIFGHPTILLHILEQIQTQFILFSKLTQLNLAGIECSQLFDRVPKESLMILLSKFLQLRSLTLTPCMTLTQYTMTERNDTCTDAFPPLKHVRFDRFCIGISKLFAQCPHISSLRVTDENLHKCQLCVGEYSNLVSTRHSSPPLYTRDHLVLAHLSLHYTESIIGNFGTLLLEEISFFQLSYLAQLNLRTNRIIPERFLSEFITSNPSIEALTIHSPMQVTSILCKGLRSLNSLKSLFLIMDSISDPNALESVISFYKCLSTVWLHFIRLSAREGRQMKSRILQAVGNVRAEVNYSNQQTYLANAMYIKMISYFYRRSGMMWDESLLL